MFGVRGQDDAYVDIGPDGIHARFGFGRASTTLDNIVRWRIEGPWRWITAIGIRRSVREGDLSFAGSPRGGVRLDVREPLRVGRLRPRTLYVGVDDLEGFGTALARLGVPGEDGRGRLRR